VVEIASGMQRFFNRINFSFQSLPQSRWSLPLKPSLDFISGICIRKILPLLKTEKTPIILGWFHTDFLNSSETEFGSIL
jgi:hypothetical protein